MAVLDLDAHPPDGVAACLAADPSHWIGSISGSDWGPLPGVDEIVLPEGTGNARYLDGAAARSSGACRPPGLAFVIAGGDVLRGDRLGKLDLTLGGARMRDVAVAAHLEGVPSVWLPGGGYSKNAWKVLAGVGLALSTGSLDPIPEDYDPIGKRFARHRRAAVEARPLRSPTSSPPTTSPSRSACARPGSGCCSASTPRPGSSSRCSASASSTSSGASATTTSASSSAARSPASASAFYGESDGKEQVLMELVLERKRVAGHPVLYVHWLSLRHPRAQFSLLRPRLPGQEVPGLGLARETGEMLALMALRLQLAGVVYRPAHFHTAFAGRHHFSFVDAARQGRFEALIRDLGDMPLLEATRAVDEGRVFLDGKPYAWEPDEMVLWLREHPEERGEVALERRARVSLGPPAPVGVPIGYGCPPAGAILSPGPTTTTCQNPARCGIRSGRARPVRVAGRASFAHDPNRDGIPMRIRLGIASLAAATLLAPAAGHASELEVYSNTQLNIQSQWRDGATTTVVPLYEFLTLTGREVSIPGGQLYFQVDGWGAANLGANPWWNGYTNSGAMSGDLNQAWVQGRFLAEPAPGHAGPPDRGLRQLADAPARRRVLPAAIHKMFTVDAYVGLPTTQRFTAYGSVFSANPTIGDLAVGGRLGFAWTTWSTPASRPPSPGTAGPPPARTWPSTSASRRSPGCTCSVTWTGASSRATTSRGSARRSPTPT